MHGPAVGKVAEVSKAATIILVVGEGGIWLPHP